MRPGQRFVVAQRLCFAAIATLGFCALAIGGGLSIAGMVAGGLSVLASLWHGRPRLPERFWLAVQLAFLAWVAVRFLSGTHVLDVFGSLLVFVQVHRLLTRHRTRDDLYCSFIAFGQILLASVLTVDPMFFVVFMGFVFFVIQGLLLSRMALSAEAAWDAERGGTDRSPPTRAYAALDAMVRLRLVAATTALAVVIQVGTLLLFFVLPRAQAAMLSGLVSPLHVSGFSDSVRLGSVGTMQLSRDPVMRVRAWGKDGTPRTDVDRLYWRGLALDRFDGRGWELSDPRRTALSRRGGSQGNPPPRKGSWTLQAEVTLEPLDSSAVFHVAPAAGIYGDFRSMDAVETDGFFFAGPPSRRTYTVFASPDPPDTDGLRRQDPRSASQTLLSRYTQLPDGLAPRIAELAQEWSAGAATPLDQVLLLQDHLRGFDYSLDQEPSRYPDPLLAFLDDVQEGHCEYFASGLSVMLRTLGMPARIVNGFSGAEWNPVGEYWVVRQLHAHSWVEVWFPQDGWVLFDPTPAAQGGVQQSARLTLLGRVRAWADVGGVTWSRVMLDYGLDTQVKGLRKGLQSLGDLGTGTVSLGDLLRGDDAQAPDARGSRQGLVLLAAVGGSLLVVLAVLALRRDRSALGRARRHASHLEERWARALPLAPDAPRSTLLGLADQAAASDPAQFAGATEIIARYNAARFGGAVITDEQVAQLRKLARRARRLKAPAGPPSSAP